MEIKLLLQGFTIMVPEKKSNEIDRQLVGWGRESRNIKSQSVDVVGGGLYDKQQTENWLWTKIATKNC